MSQYSGVLVSPRGGTSVARSAGSRSAEEPCPFHDCAGHAPLSQPLASCRLCLDRKLDALSLVPHEARPQDDDFTDQARGAMTYINRCANRRDARREATIERRHGRRLEPRDQPRCREHSNIATAHRLGGVVYSDNTLNLRVQSDERLHCQRLTMADGGPPDLPTGLRDAVEAARGVREHPRAANTCAAGHGSPACPDRHTKA